MISIISSSRYKINRQKIKAFVENIFEKEQMSSRIVIEYCFVGKK